VSVTPYLTLADANAAIRFYVEAFGAVEKFRMPAEGGGKTMHALAIAGECPASEWATVEVREIGRCWEGNP
jgi:uncharacterized glyoxalase superfamily protein PhnB